MPRFVVLLRGVNVGKANRVPMADFRAMLEALGHSDVKTLLNSGNAVFTSTRRNADKLADEIGAGLAERFGVTTPVIVKSASELQAIVDGNPIVPPEAEHARFLVAFAMESGRLAALESLRPLLLPGERLAVTAHAAYLHCANGLLESQAGEALLVKVGKDVTSRNWGTTLKLFSVTDTARG